MTGDELYTFTCNILLGGIQMNVVAFYQLLNMVKNTLEGERPWLRLKTEDATQSWATADTFQTGAKTLPADFRQVWPAKGNLSSMKLVDASGNLGVDCSEIFMEQKFEYKDSAGFFYIDHANGQFYLTGQADKAYTIHLFYKKKSPDIAAGTSWIFPSEYHIGLAEIVASMHKAGIDYDDINSRMAAQNSADYARVRASMIAWDTELQLNALAK